PASRGRRSPPPACRSPCATRPDVSYHAGLHAADGQGSAGSLGCPRLERGAMALAESHGGGAPSDGLSVAQSGQSQTPKKNGWNRCHVCEYRKKDQEATASSSIKRLSSDGKATEVIGEVSRGGLTRGEHRACDHDLGLPENYIPCGIVDEDSARLRITFGSAFKTS